MKPGEECGYCATILYTHCVELRHGPQACEIRERYYTDPGFGSDEALAALRQSLTPGQLLDGVRAVQVRRLQGLGPAGRDTMPQDKGARP